MGVHRDVLKNVSPAYGSLAPLLVSASIRGARRCRPLGASLGERGEGQVQAKRVYKGDQERVLQELPFNGHCLAHGPKEVGAVV